MKKIITLVSTVTALSLLANCGKSSSSSGGPGVSLALKLAPAISSFASDALLYEGVRPMDVVGDHMSFTPSGLKIPIMKITVSAADGSNAQTLYKCASTTEADCLVDLADQTALDAIATAAGTVAVTSGTYGLVSLYTCADGKGGSDQTTVYVKGSATFSGATWRTDDTATSGIDNSSTGTAALTTITNWGCSTKSVALTPAVTIDATVANKLNIIVDNTFGASFGTTISSGRGGCKATGASGNGVCAEYPALLPYVGTATTSTKRFKISHHITATGSIVDNKANALIIVAMADTQPIMAYGRIYYSATSALISNNTAPQDTTYGGPNYITETNYTSFVATADNSSIAFKQGGSADTYAATFAAFKLVDHTGDVVTRDGLVTWKYHAIPLN